MTAPLLHLSSHHDLKKKSGFNFDHFLRNQCLSTQGIQVPKATKTGTTIVGVIFKVIIFHFLI
ncbi:hypothetical protein HMI56_002816 [Coelomomyces lativittatus]|nr:hypothetical protein HMI56_002816 [Coelomomyces lativittatus]